MADRILLSAETGSDISHELARELGILLIPMHVCMGSDTLDDGTFPPEDVCTYYDRTGTVPTTSASTPYDFESVYDPVFAENPDARILHLAYSAVTTCSCQNGQLIVSEKPYAGQVRFVDTKHVSSGQGSVVLAVHKWLQEHPEATLKEAAAAAEEFGSRTQMCFIPKNLDYLRAGGRCSNAAALVGNLLQLHPCIEVTDGRLFARKKYRGKLEKVAPQVLRDFDSKHGLSRDRIVFINPPYLEDAVRAALDAEAEAMGFQQISWVKSGCVITCHGGAGAFGIVGTTKK